MTAPDLTILKTAAEVYAEAASEVEGLTAELAAAKSRLRAAQDTRLSELLAFVGEEQSPEKMRAAALAMGVSTGRVYQLVRRYDSQRKPS